MLEAMDIAVTGSRGENRGRLAGSDYAAVV